MFRLRFTKVLVGVLAILVLCTGSCAFIRSMFPGERFVRVAKSMAGKNEVEVVAALGTPEHTVKAGELKGRPMHFPWAGMNFVPIPTRPISDKVLYYSDAWWAAYVYIDRAGKVEHVAIAGT